MNFLVYVYFLVFSVCLILFHFILFFYLTLPLLVESFFFLCLVSALFAAGIHFQWVKNSEGKQFRTGSVGLNCEQMKEGEQYSEYPVERNPRAYMSMRDYINRPWKNQQPVERNPNEYRSMRDYRNQWLSSPYGITTIVGGITRIPHGNPDLHKVKHMVCTDSGSPFYAKCWILKESYVKDS